MRETVNTAEELEELLRDTSARIENTRVNDENELYVSLEGSGSDALTGADTLIAHAVVYDWLPVGIVDSGAMRFVPKDSLEADSLY